MNDKVKIEDIIKLLEDSKNDYNKLFDRNFKAACTRLRKQLQEVNKMSKVLRKQALEHKKTIKK